jgi:hypothetical protein
VQQFPKSSAEYQGKVRNVPVTGRGKIATSILATR